jgi:hypothetical protein
VTDRHSLQHTPTTQRFWLLTTTQLLLLTIFNIIWARLNNGWNDGAYELTKPSRPVTFTLRREDCPVVYLNGRHIPQDSTVKYLGINLDRRITWKTHIFAKRKHLGLLFQRMYWILGRKSELSLANKVILYKTILNPIWTYGIPLWGTASHSNIEILQRFQNKALRTMVNAPWYVPNKLLHTDLQMSTISKRNHEV